MAVIHIQEVNSDQVTEIIAETVEKALWAYAHNACFRWSEWAGATAECYPKSNAIKKWCSCSTMNSSPFAMYMGNGSPLNGNKRAFTLLFFCAF